MFDSLSGTYTKCLEVPGKFIVLCLECAISEFVICDGHLSRPGGRGGRQCREPLEKALEPLVESLGEVLHRGLHSSFATDGFGTGLSLLKLQCGLMLAALCLNFPD